MRILGLVILVVAVVVSFGLHLVDIASIVIVLGLTFGGLLAGFGGKVGCACKAVWTDTQDRETILTGLAVFERGKSIAVIAGFIGTLIGHVMMLEHLDDVSALGPGMAISLLTVLYGLLLAYGCFLPSAAYLRRRLEQLPQ